MLLEDNSFLEISLACQHRVWPLHISSLHVYMTKQRFNLSFLLCSWCTEFRPQWILSIYHSLVVQNISMQHRELLKVSLLAIFYLCCQAPQHQLQIVERIDAKKLAMFHHQDQRLMQEAILHWHQPAWAKWVPNLSLSLATKYKQSHLKAMSNLMLKGQ